jgi:hypothetical protein
MGKVTLKTAAGPAVINSEILQSESADIETTIEVPATDNKPVAVKLYIGGSKEPVYGGIFTPRRRWLVYALPMEQADFGYNDLPAHTLEWENRFFDKALEIQQKYDSYSYTLDAAANLESYLSTRKDEKSYWVSPKRQVGNERSLHKFFYRSSTPEELYRMLDFSLAAGHKYRFAVDSASQTDMPSVTWALPQILADAGIRYFTSGSDPIRGAFNPIGHLNFLSPFYWETPTGSKVLVWSGISYVAVSDMTWAVGAPTQRAPEHTRILYSDLLGPFRFSFFHTTGMTTLLMRYFSLACTMTKYQYAIGATLTPSRSGTRNMLTPRSSCYAAPVLWPHRGQLWQPDQNIPWRWRIQLGGRSRIRCADCFDDSDLTDAISGRRKL